MPETRKLNLRLPLDLRQQAAALAELQGISLNAFLILGVRNWVTYQRRGMGMPPTLPAKRRAGPPPSPSPRPTHPVAKVGRNDPCPCGSGRKWKVCHGKP